MTINDACDYIILKMTEGSDTLNNIKLQKLLYYVQAWHLAFEKVSLFDEGENFQAWVHGPVSRIIYSRFSENKSLYSDITYEDIRDDFDMSKLDKDNLEHIDIILESYAKFTGTELENMTHKEEPWIQAREGYRPSERCEVEIDNKIMQDYYGNRLAE